MPSERVRVLAHFTVQPEHVDAFIRGAREKLVAPTRTERGCIQYDLWQDDADPTRFTMVETWESGAALAAHLGNAALREAVMGLMPMASKPPEIHRMRSVVDDV